MMTRAIARGDVTIVECTQPLERAGDALELISACFEHDSTRVLVDAAVLPAEFFDLRTRFAGEFIQKLANYGIRVAAVVEPAAQRGDTFTAFVREARSGRQFRIHDSREAAEAWLQSE